jgi:cellulose biosynthesis protein BcsQ
MKALVFFNNKGGVGKTTLACNVAAYLSHKKNKRVLLVDADPQCNATQIVLSEDECQEIYLGDRAKEHLTLFDLLSSVEAGEPTLKGPVNPILGTTNRFGCDLIPGHPRMSLVEDKLSVAWDAMQGGTPAGFRASNWCAQLFEHVSSRYDVVIFDVGPSLGALNRTVILAADFLITPFGCDIFSLLGIQNISSWIQLWKKQYDRALEHAKEDRPDVLEQYPIIKDTDAKFRFAGYSVQQYVTKSFKSGKRPVKAYDRIMAEIPTAVTASLGSFKPQGLGDEGLSLGHIPFMYSLIPLAQSQRSPIHKLRDLSVLVGNQYGQAQEYAKLMESLCTQLLTNIGAGS